MAKDKFSATWVSHSSITDFLNCPRAYYLKNMWKRPETKHKVQIVTPALSLGSAIHEVVEALSILPTDRRFDEGLIPKFEQVWVSYSGKVGGFLDADTEHHYKERGLAMLRRVTKHPGPLKNLAVKINMELPHFWLSEEENIILCGKIDWLEYFKEQNAVRIIDFKTSKSEERKSSLQLPVYMLLATNCQTRRVAGAAYWYLESSDEITEKVLPQYDSALGEVLKIARSVKLARSLARLTCATNGCHFCEPLEKIFRGEAQFVGQNAFGQDLFLIPEVTKEMADTIL